MASSLGVVYAGSSKLRALLESHGVNVVDEVENARVLVVGACSADDFPEDLQESRLPVVVLVEKNTHRNLIPPVLEASGAFDSWCNCRSAPKFAALAARLKNPVWTPSNQGSAGKSAARVVMKKESNLQEIRALKTRQEAALAEAEKERIAAEQARSRAAAREVEYVQEKAKCREQYAQATAQALEQNRERARELAEMKACQEAAEARRREQYAQATAQALEQNRERARELAEMKARQEAAEARRREEHPQTAQGNGGCTICLDAIANAVLVPCGHICCCYDCSTAFITGKCPICRADVARSVKVYDASTDLHE